MCHMNKVLLADASSVPISSPLEGASWLPARWRSTGRVPVSRRPGGRSGETLMPLISTNRESAAFVYRITTFRATGTSST